MDVLFTLGCSPAPLLGTQASHLTLTHRYRLEEAEPAVDPVCGLRGGWVHRGSGGLPACSLHFLHTSSWSYSEIHPLPFLCRVILLLHPFLTTGKGPPKLHSSSTAVAQQWQGPWGLPWPPESAVVSPAELLTLVVRPSPSHTKICKLVLKLSFHIDISCLSSRHIYPSGTATDFFLY